MSISILSRIYDTILSRRSGDPTTSYVASLFAKGPKKIAQKVGEEATETVLASAGGDTKEIIAESTDLLFHLLILLAAHSITLDDIAQEFERREGISGIDEKNARK